MSNFSSSVVHLDSIEYPTVEHAFQAAKTFDPEIRESIRTAKRPADARCLGRKLSLRSDWEAVKLSVMMKLLEEKFSDEDLGSRFLNTGDAVLVEGNTHGDRIWGQDPVGSGQNKLGQCLMKIRSDLKSRALRG